MKNISALLLLTLVTTTAAMAGTTKVCFGSKESEDTRGIILSIKVNKKEITIKTIKGDSYNGTYSAYNTSVQAHNGKTYLEYKGEYVDQQDVIMVDQDLLQKETSGLLQIRSRGEGYFNAVYFCKDDNR
jgi:hypothetical protein